MAFIDIRNIGLVAGIELAPIAGSPAWRPGFRVRYAVAFEYADGTVTRSDWWRTAEDQDGERTDEHGVLWHAG